MSSAADKGRRTKVFFVHPKTSTFILGDLGLLGKHYEVRRLDVGSYQPSLKNKLAVACRIFRGVLRSDVTFTWFADKAALCTVRSSRMFFRPSVVVIGGYEVAKLPEFEYGSQLDPKKAEAVKSILKNASVVLPVSKFTQAETAKVSEAKRVEMVYNCVDTEAFVPSPAKGDIVLTVGEMNRKTVKLKGFETFVACAARLPGLRFVVVGPSPDGAVDELKAGAPKNVEFLGEVPNEKLREIYARAKVYCQLSWYESFGMALAEAMSCGCVPVVASSGALPEVVGDVGFVVPAGDVPATSRAIQDAVRRSDGGRARERVMSLFSAGIRERELVRIIDGLISVKRR